MTVKTFNMLANDIKTLFADNFRFSCRRTPQRPLNSITA